MGGRIAELCLADRSAAGVGIAQTQPSSIPTRGLNTSRAIAEHTDLQGGEFIYEQPAFPDVGFTFKHTLTQEVAYNSVLIERRKILHERIANEIESLHESQLDEHFDELAYHYSRSDNVVVGSGGPKR